MHGKFHTLMGAVTPAIRAGRRSPRRGRCCPDSAVGAPAGLAAPTLGAVMNPLGTPDYFGTVGNWAFSPLPTGPIASVTVNSGGSGYSATPTVTITDVWGTGTGATASAVVTTGVITALPSRLPAPATLRRS